MPVTKLRGEKPQPKWDHDGEPYHTDDCPNLYGEMNICHATGVILPHPPCHPHICHPAVMQMHQQLNQAVDFLIAVCMSGTTNKQLKKISKFLEGVDK
jgi:protein tyrosine phosphatase (PTP) superfamily phosphohydrolase (DUF442 family)